MAHGDLRAADVDRDQAAALLREHFSAGRIDQDELDERLKNVYSSRTMSELASLLADLPRLPASRAEQRLELAERRQHLQRRILQQSGCGLGLFALCTGIWLLDGASGQFWPVWVLIVVLIPLVRGGWALYGPAPDLDRLEADLNRRDASGRRSRQGQRRP
jgi:hypothetical protein